MGKVHAVIPWSIQHGVKKSIHNTTTLHIIETVGTEDEPKYAYLIRRKYVSAA